MPKSARHFRDQNAGGRLAGGARFRRLRFDRVVAAHVRARPYRRAARDSRGAQALLQVETTRSRSLPRVPTTLYTLGIGSRWCACGSARKTVAPRARHRALASTRRRPRMRAPMPGVPFRRRIGEHFERDEATSHRREIASPSGPFAAGLTPDSTHSATRRWHARSPPRGGALLAVKPATANRPAAQPNQRAVGVGGSIDRRCVSGWQTRANEASRHTVTN